MVKKTIQSKAASDSGNPPVAQPVPTVPTATSTPTPNSSSSSTNNVYISAASTTPMVAPATKFWIASTPMPGMEPVYQETFFYDSPNKKFNDCIWEKLDKLDLTLDVAGVIVGVATVGWGEKVTNGAQILKNADKVINTTSLVNSIVSTATSGPYADWYTPASAISDVFGLGIPIIPDIIGIGFNYGQAIEKCFRE